MPYWKSLAHSGVAFPKLHDVKGLKLLVRGKELAISPLAEEMAYNWAKKKDTPYVKDPVFISNFMKDFLPQLPEEARDSRFEDLDFSQFNSLVDHEKKTKELMTKEAKKSQAADRKTEREALRERFGRATVDGKTVDIANWMVEPPGLFMGRGAHPLRGRWKPRVTHGDVTLNLAEDAPRPEGEWAAIVSDKNSMWLARWIDKLTGKEKYVWLHESSDLQQSRNRAKYDKAAKIERNIGKIKARIGRSLDSKDERERKVATVCWLIDVVGMRVGDEKDEDEADTVGATTLRVEHVKIEGNTLHFDFLGKDSVRWVKSVRADESLVRNLRGFMANKKQDDLVFDGVGSGTVNKFLSEIVDGLSAKVFRTYHATETTKTCLARADTSRADDLEKMFIAKESNLAAAIYCNHKRTPPKNWDESMRKKKEKLAEYEAKGKAEQARKLSKSIDFETRRKDYNLNTSLKNYIDPRVYKAWFDHVGLDWKKFYTSSLQRKFGWVAGTHVEWKEEERPLVIEKQ